MFRLFFLIYLSYLVMGVESIFAAIPFRDITPSSPYYDAVNELYNQRVIVDDGSGLFRPKDTIDRDAFVGLSVSVSCKSCLTPTIDDIISYATSPFIDVTKVNPFYYCISYASAKNIIHGYPPDASGQMKCNDGTKWNSTPFCAKNTTTRIEAAAMLLRQANLWNDELNKNTTKTRTIEDVSEYWYGYANKAIDAGLINLSSGNTIRPDESMTRGEFAIMAAKVLSYNQCMITGTDNTLGGRIDIVGSDGKLIQKSSFSKDDTFSLVGVIDGDRANYDYTWRAVDSISGQIFTSTGIRLDSSTLSTGNWYVELTVKNRGTNTTMTTLITTITKSDESTIATTENPLGNGKNTTTNGTINSSIIPSIILTTSTLTNNKNTSIRFDGYAFGDGPMTYNWNLGDGVQIYNTGTSSISHTYRDPGNYSVVVTLTDKDGKTAQSSLVIRVTGESDTDGDGVNDTLDLCPNVVGSDTNRGCPIIQTNNYGNSTQFPSYNPTNNISTNASSLGSSITIQSANNQILTTSNIPSNTPFSLVPKVSQSGNYNYLWTATHTITGEKITSTDTIFLSSLLGGSGSWIIDMSVRDNKNNTELSRSSLTLDIISSGSKNYIGVSIGADTLTTPIGKTIDFRPYFSGSNIVSSTWNFGDGSPNISSNNIQQHTFTTIGAHIVTLTIKDISGNISSASMTIYVTDTDSDGDGVNDSRDFCKGVFGDIQNNGCPKVTPLLSTLSKNSCLTDMANTRGLISMKPVCLECPCNTSVLFAEAIRSCDVLFPAILSLDKTTVYSRGGLYQIR